MQNNKEPEMAWRVLVAPSEKGMDRQQIKLSRQKQEKGGTSLHSNNSSVSWPWNIMDAVRVHGLTEERQVNRKWGVGNLSTAVKYKMKFLSCK